MTDKSWMLNPKAIRQAKECIGITKELTGKRLKLSDPQFIKTLHEQVELTGSNSLGEAYARLISMAGVGFVNENLSQQMLSKSEAIPSRKSSGESSDIDPSATIEHLGRVYPRYRSGLEFKGVYRGQPTYS